MVSSLTSANDKCYKFSVNVTKKKVFACDSIYAIARICYHPSVCVSVCHTHTGGSVKNAWS